MQRFLDKTNFLNKFSCFDGYMEYVDKNSSGELQSINYNEYRDFLKR